MLELRPRCSLTLQGARLFVCVVAGTTFGVGAILALQGFWPVLAFAGFAKLRAPPVAPHPSRLMLESHGRGYEVGRFLTEDERRTLAARLIQLVGNVNESPAQRCERG